MAAIGYGMERGRIKSAPQAGGQFRTKPTVVPEQLEIKKNGLKIARAHTSV